MIERLTGQLVRHWEGSPLVLGAFRHFGRLKPKDMACLRQNPQHMLCRGSVPAGTSNEKEGPH